MSGIVMPDGRQAAQMPDNVVKRWTNGHPNSVLFAYMYDVE